MLIELSEVSKMTNQEKQTTSLERQKWVDIAVQAMKDGGVQEIRVELLAKKLGITRGSFYWHFKKRQDLLDAVLEHWEKAGTLEIISVLENSKSASEERLRELLILSFSVSEKDFSFERSIRAWAMTSFTVKEVVARVDQQRIAYLQQLYKEQGWSENDAKQNARLVYFSRTGLFHQAEVPELSERLQSAHYVLNLLESTQHSA